MPCPTVPSGFVREELLRAAAVAGRSAQEADGERKLSAATLAALDNSGFARHFVPRRWNGREGTFREVVAATATIAEGCTSAAWCAVLWAAHGRFASFLPHAAQEEIWGSSPDVRIAAAIAPTGGRARAVAGGWSLEGTWAMVSAVDDAHWVLFAAPTDQTRAADANPWVGLFAVPREAVTVRDTWNSTGLRGTGTNTASLRDTFVPEHRAVELDAVLAGEGPENRARCHAAPAHLAGGLMFAAPALGAARAALNVWTMWAAGSSGGGVPRPLDDVGAQERLARASVDIDSVELLLSKAAERADTADMDGGLVGLNRLEAALGVDRLADAVDLLFRFGGTHMRDADGDLQRRWRDILTIASHGALRREPAAAAYAQCVAGHPMAGTGPEQKVEL